MDLIVYVVCVPKLLLVFCCVAFILYTLFYAKKKIKILKSYKNWLWYWDLNNFFWHRQTITHGEGSFIHIGECMLNTFTHHLTFMNWLIQYEKAKLFAWKNPDKCHSEFLEGHINGNRLLLLWQKASEGQDEAGRREQRQQDITSQRKLFSPLIQQPRESTDLIQ